MLRFVSHLAILCLVPAIALGQPVAGPAPPPDVPALVARAEPAVACILVSRSPLYRKIGMLTGFELPGVLGDVPSDLLSRLPGTESERIETSIGSSSSTIRCTFPKRSAPASSSIRRGSFSRTITSSATP